MDEQKLKEIKEKIKRSNKYILYVEFSDIKRLFEYVEKQQKEIEELKHFKEEVTEIIKYADDTAEPTYWNIRKLLGE